MSVCACACVYTSILLTRPSWKEQSRRLLVQMWRYLHQWHGNTLLTQEVHLRGRETLFKQREIQKIQKKCAAVLMNPHGQSVKSVRALHIWLYILDSLTAEKQLPYSEDKQSHGVRRYKLYLMLRLAYFFTCIVQKWDLNTSGPWRCMWRYMLRQDANTPIEI